LAYNKDNCENYHSSNNNFLPQRHFDVFVVLIWLHEGTALCALLLNATNLLGLLLSCLTCSTLLICNKLSIFSGSCLYLR
jgi:hypothetical protein